MPELPEVETIRQDLRKRILRIKIREIEVKKKKLVRNSLNYFNKILKNNFFVDVERRGKLLIFILADKKNYLLTHLKMTGQLVCSKRETKADKHTHVIINFNDKTKLFFNDLRQFGYMQIVNAMELEKIKAGYGIEPLTKNFTLEKFTEIIKSKKLPIKAVIMDQTLIAGLGNIYADESCFQAGIYQLKKTNSLKDNEIKNLFQAINVVIKNAIKYRGSSVKDYVDAGGKRGDYVRFLKVYGRAGEKCLKCHSIIKKTKLGGRGTSYCPVCQK